MHNRRKWGRKNFLGYPENLFLFFWTLSRKSRMVSDAECDVKNYDMWLLKL